MYLDNGREIYESDKYPGYFIDANTGAFCDEEGNYIGGNIDNGDKPGCTAAPLPSQEIVFVTRSGNLYYPKRGKQATLSMTLAEARRKGYHPSQGYITFKHNRQLRVIRKARSNNPTNH